MSTQVHASYSARLDVAKFKQCGEFKAKGSHQKHAKMFVLPKNGVASGLLCYLAIFQPIRDARRPEYICWTLGTE